MIDMNEPKVKTQFMQEMGFEPVSAGVWKPFTDVEPDQWWQVRNLYSPIAIHVNGEPANQKDICELHPDGYSAVNRDDDGHVMVDGENISVSRHKAVVTIVEG